MKKVVWRLDFYSEKIKEKALQTVSRLRGVESIAIDTKDKKMTVTGDVDPVKITAKLRKLCPTDMVSVGPAKEPEKKKEEQGKKDDDNKDDDEKDDGKKKDGEKDDGKKDEPKKGGDDNKKKDTKEYGGRLMGEPFPYHQHPLPPTTCAVAALSSNPCPGILLQKCGG